MSTMNQPRELKAVSRSGEETAESVSTSMSPLQRKELGVLKEIIKVFENNNLHYCAIGGTCLGAVRHKGFIPWDDDIDIAVPRKEYELFRKELYKQLPAQIQKVDCDVSRSHDFFFTKIHDSTTTQIEQYAINAPDRITGAFVDVYPLDGRPDSQFRRKLWFIKYMTLMKLNARRRCPPKKITSVRRGLGEIYRLGLRLLFRYNFFSDKMLSHLSKYDISKCKTAIWNGAGGDNAKRFDYNLSFDSELFTDTICASFEDISIRIPRRYHDYLTTHFGDYMKLPPENERGNWHHVVISDMETPCAFYAKLVSEGKTYRTGHHTKEDKQ